MRILEVVPYLSTASIAVGQNEIIYQTAAGLAGRGHQVSVYTSDEQLHHDLIRQLEGLGVTICPFGGILEAAAFYLMSRLILSAGRILSADLTHLHAYRSFQNPVVVHYARRSKFLFPLRGLSPSRNIAARGLSIMDCSYTGNTIVSTTIDLDRKNC